MCWDTLTGSCWAGPTSTSNCHPARSFAPAAQARTWGRHLPTRSACLAQRVPFRRQAPACPAPPPRAARRGSSSRPARATQMRTAARAPTNPPTPPTPGSRRCLATPRETGVTARGPTCRHVRSDTLETAPTPPSAPPARFGPPRSSRGPTLSLSVSAWAAGKGATASA